MPVCISPPRTKYPTSKPGRGGVSTVEMIGALAVMAVLLAFAGQWTGSVMQQRRHIERRRLAMDAASNVLALAMASAFEDVTKSNLEAMAGPYTPQRAKWNIEVQEVPLKISPEMSAKKIVVGLQYGDATKKPARPLVAWKFPIDELAEGDNVKN